MLYKKASRDNFANYRAICLLCHAYKLLSAVVVVLDHANVSCKVRQIVQAIYSAASGSVHVRQHDGSILDSDPFDINRGVLQGDIASSSEFIAGLWRTLQKHDLPNMGVTVGAAPYTVDVSKLEYADDIGFIDIDPRDGSIRITSISRGSLADASMSISIPKTKSMHIHAREKVSETLESEIIAMNLKFKCPACDLIEPLPTHGVLLFTKGDGAMACCLLNDHTR